MYDKWDTNIIKAIILICILIAIVYFTFAEGTI